MKTRYLAAAFLAAFVFSGCGDDPVQPPIPPVDPWPDPSAKESVLYYVQRAYNERNSGRYEQILDDGFKNFLSDGDVNNGLPEQWDLAQEKTVTRNLFSKTQVGDLPLVKSINMDLLYENGVTWTEVVPTSAPTETWYSASVYYSFQILVHYDQIDEDIVYYPPGSSKAQITVRNAGTDSKPDWKLVEFRDLGGGSLATLRMASTEQTSWGKVKALYR